MILGVIPARGGSKGIKRKNMRILNGHPLLWYIIKTAKSSRLLDDVVVTTEDEEIKIFSLLQGVKVKERPKHLSLDHVTLDPVVKDAVEWYESTYGTEVSYVVTLQPTSPLLSPKTLDDALREFLKSNADTMISVVDATHLYWKMEEGRPIPDYRERLNRQWLPKRYRETGAFVICKREVLSALGTRIGNKVEVFEMPENEAVDIDTPVDWIVASSLLLRMRIKFVTTGNRKVGMGHVFRTLSLADMWIGHEITFVLVNSSEEAEKQIEERGYTLVRAKTLREAAQAVGRGDMVINDILDTPKDYIQELKGRGAFVVNFEDLGEGADIADLVINSLYERINPPDNHIYGYQYECISENFLCIPPNGFREKARNILITFGGSDPNNLTLRTLKAIKGLENRYLIKVILGPAYPFGDALKSFLKESGMGDRISVLQKVKNMALEMRDVDLGITSNGRTVYEFAAMGVPVISIAQNDRETLHLFARYSRGVKYLGIACNVTEEMIRSAVMKVMEDSAERRRMFESLPIRDIRSGILRVKEMLETEYRRWKYERDKAW